MKLQCEHSDIEQVLQRLHMEINRYNAYINKSVRINEKNMDLHVAADLPSFPNEALFKVPECCLPIVDKFHLSVEDDALCIHGVDDDILESHKTIGELMIELYNCSNKIEDYKKTSPWFAVSHHELLEYLIQGRAKNPRIVKYHELWKQGCMNSLILDGFLGRRCFSLKSKHYADNVYVMHPFIDFLNHHPRAPGYQVSENQNVDTAAEKVLWTLNSQPLLGVDECFVNYSLLDPFDALLSYGFVDINSIICRSVPLQVNLSNGLVIDIESRIPAFPKGIPPNLKDLVLYMPHMWKFDTNQGHIYLSHLIIPGARAPRSLRRILTYIIDTTCQGSSKTLSRTLLMDLVREAEASIISENLKYYSILLDMCCEIAQGINKPADAYCTMVKDMAQLQIDWINNYKDMQETGQNQFTINEASDKWGQRTLV